jgi:hypothetical protein
VRKITAIHLHHSAGSELDTPADVAHYAVERNVGISHDPYHYHVWRMADGGELGANRWTISPGRAIEEEPASIKGHNTGAIAVCVHGRWDGVPLPRWARDRLVGLVRDLCARYGVPVEAVRGHREVSAGTLCPGYDCAEIRRLVAEGT